MRVSRLSGSGGADTLQKGALGSGDSRQRLRVTMVTALEPWLQMDSIADPRRSDGASQDLSKAPEWVSGDTGPSDPKRPDRQSRTRRIEGV